MLPFGRVQDLHLSFPLREFPPLALLFHLRQEGVDFLADVWVLHLEKILVVQVQVIADLGARSVGQFYFINPVEQPCPLAVAVGLPQVVPVELDWR